MKKFNIPLPTLINFSFWSLLFFLFCWWHGVFQPPLSQIEINEFAHNLYSMDSSLSIDEYKQLLANDNGKPIYMVNVIKYFDDPVKTDNETEVIEAEKLVRTYNNYVGKFLIQRGSYPLFLGTALGGTASAWGVDGEDAEGWSETAIIRYRNIRTLMELATDEQFNKNLDYKKAALEKTIIYPTESKIIAGGLSYQIFFMLLSGGLITQLFLNKK